jgi:hypothetical protein
VQLFGEFKNYSMMEEFVIDLSQKTAATLELSFFQQMLTKNPKQRISAATALIHPYFENCLQKF